jgi:cbb3-type cytochrome oxidase subunit 1
VGNPLLSIQPYEYAEAPLLVDILIVLCAVAIIISVHATVLARTKPTLYVSIWYLLGGLYTTAITYLAGNFSSVGVLRAGQSDHSRVVAA